MKSKASRSWLPVELALAMEAAFSCRCELHTQAARSWRSSDALHVLSQTNPGNQKQATPSVRCILKWSSLVVV